MKISTTNNNNYNNKNNIIWEYEENIVFYINPERNRERNHIRKDLNFVQKSKT